MAGIINDGKLSRGPVLGKANGVCRGADYIIAPLYHHARNMRDPGHVGQNLVFRIKPASILELMALDPGKGPRIAAVDRRKRANRPERSRRGLPSYPRPSKAGLHTLILGGEAPVIGADQIIALFHRDWRDELLPSLRVKARRAACIEPVKLGARHGEDAAKEQRRNADRMRLRIKQRQRRAPGATKEHPLLDLEMGT